MDDTRDITPKDKGKSKVRAGMKHFNVKSWLDELRRDSRARKDRGDKLEDVFRLKFDTVTVQLRMLKEGKVVAYLDGDETLENELEDAIIMVDEEQERCESVLLACWKIHQDQLRQRHKHKTPQTLSITSNTCYQMPILHAISYCYSDEGAGIFKV